MITVEQLDALDRLQDIHEQIVERKAAIRAEVQARYAEELQDLRLAESIAANDAYTVGSSLTRIGHAMGTSDWRTIKERLAYAGEEGK